MLVIPLRSSGVVSPTDNILSPVTAKLVQKKQVFLQGAKPMNLSQIFLAGKEGTAPKPDENSHNPLA
ncbi:hypothetical protein M427DRAFT_61221 [Gonapodya prolifera JEL478]|uniref:Uncharacterized protein n=1 Tax=Gonapodya prolifera (strain JEL478) TaxID=1344416 RepID=A0A139A2M5_GONPJ|nr:hypothetical protein M427DRAFT_61221 [Gonapodya prolifera JEL478]|eukprot:KXS11001.1 hypothetical protein M427DRAFT_61221 [Gonapodya prolifera JEL478]